MSLLLSDLKTFSDEKGHSLKVSFHKILQFVKHETTTASVPKPSMLLPHPLMKANFMLDKIPFSHKLLFRMTRRI